MYSYVNIVVITSAIVCLRQYIKNYVHPIFPYSISLLFLCFRYWSKRERKMLHKDCQNTVNEKIEIVITSYYLHDNKFIRR